MELEQRMARLESAHAKLRAEKDFLLISFCALIAGELSPTVLAKRKESLIATALNTHAPESAIDGIELAYNQVSVALANWRIRL